MWTYRQTTQSHAPEQLENSIQKLFQTGGNVPAILDWLTALQASGYPLQVPSEPMATLIVKCAEHGYQAVLQQLVTWKVPLAQTTRQQQHALSIASRHNRLPMVDFLVTAAHFPIDLVGEQGTTALHEATKCAMPHPAIVSLLLENGANPNARDQAGNTPLHSAVRTQKALILELLLRHGADTRAANHAGKTPYDLALSLGNTAPWLPALFKRQEA